MKMISIDNPIARITAAFILIFSLFAVVGVWGMELTAASQDILTLMIGASITYLFVAQKKAANSEHG